MDAPCMQSLGGAELHGVPDPLGEVLPRRLRRRRASAALPEPAERAADHADVGEVDVAIDDERSPVTGQLARS